MERREDGMNIYEDQCMDHIEEVIRVQGIQDAYKAKAGHAWLAQVRDDDLKLRLRQMNEKHLRILEMILLEGKHPVQVRLEMNMELNEFRCEIGNIRAIFRNVM